MEMGKHHKNLSLEYLDNKINRLIKEFRDFESVSMKWQRDTDDNIDKLKEKEV